MPISAILRKSGGLTDDLKKCLTGLQINWRAIQIRNQQRLINIGAEPACRNSHSIAKDKRIAELIKLNMVNLVLLFVQICKSIRDKQSDHVICPDLLLGQVIHKRNIGLYRVAEIVGLLIAKISSGG